MAPHVSAVADRNTTDRWWERALCSGKTELFFEPPGERRIRRERREAIARSYCAVCPVADPCREAGRSNGENGIWGGENDEQRAYAGHAPGSIFRRDVAAARRVGLRRREEPDTEVA